MESLWWIIILSDLIVWTLTLTKNKPAMQSYLIHIVSFHIPENALYDVYYNWLCIDNVIKITCLT